MFSELCYTVLFDCKWRFVTRFNTCDNALVTALNTMQHT